LHPKLNDFISVESGVNYFNCIYAYQHKVSGLSYIGQAKNYVVRDGQHLSSVKSDDSKYFDAVYNNPDDWYRVILRADVHPDDLDIVEAKMIQEYGTYQATRGYNKTKGNLITVKKSLVASKQLDLSGNPVLEKKSWDIKNNLYNFSGTKSFKKGRGSLFSAVEAHASEIPVFDDSITDFYEPFAGAANISRYLANEGHFHDGIRLHLNDANMLTYYKLRAVKESPDELLAAIHDYLPVNIKIADVKGCSLSDANHPQRDVIDSMNDMFRNDIINSDLSVYSVELAAKLFVWNSSCLGLYYMVDGSSNQSNPPMITRGSYICPKHTYDGSSIAEFSEFFNYYDVVLSCMDYKDMVFGDAVSSIIYCDSPYPDASNPCPDIDMGEYAAWLADLDVNGYCFTVSCNHDCLVKLQSGIRDINPAAKVENIYLNLYGSASKVRVLLDGILKNHSRY
jgi:site-specific DNA-adenine methylase